MTIQHAGVSKHCATNHAAFGLTALCCALVALAPAARAAVDQSAWEKRQALTITTPGPVRVALAPELLDAARVDLADLRLLAPDGGEVPFAVLRQPPIGPATITLPVTPRLQGRTTVLEFSLERPEKARRIRLGTMAPEFVKGATLEVRSADGGWRTIVRDVVVFRLRSGVENVLLDVPADGPVADFRITIDDARDAPVPFSQVGVEVAPSLEMPKTDVPVAIGAVDSSAEETRLAVDFGLRHRPVAALTLAVGDPIFERPVRLIARTAENDEVREEVLAAGTLRRLALPGGRSFTQLTMRVEVVLPAARLELAIDNGDSPPLQVTGIEAATRAIHIAFHAPAAGTFTLLAGNAGVTAPRYDVAAFAGDWAQLPVAAPAFHPLEANPGYRPASPPAEVPEVAGLFDPKGWKHRRDVTIEAAGAQVLELDPEVLARAQSGLGDLRLVRGDRQVPYLLERTSRQRTLALTLAPAPDAKRPRVGRWTIDLPYAGVPITRLVFTVSEPLFERRAAVFEMREDRRGQRWASALGEAAWTRRGPADSGRCAVALSTAPTGRRLVLEIDHGDNTPFAPMSVEAVYPLRRVRFASPARAAVVLHYGNPEATAPRYDLQLAAPKLLASQEHTAVLAPPAALEADDGGGLTLGTGAGRYAFWGALALVVVVLVWLVARLLPKPPD
jgi:hypothetical protein